MHLFGTQKATSPAVSGLVLALMLMTICLPVRSIDRTTLVQYANTLAGKSGKELKDALTTLMQPTYVLSFGADDDNDISTGNYHHTWYGFYFTDRSLYNNECRNRYSTLKFYFKDSDLGRSIEGMNIEHSFPKSWWGGSTDLNSYKDLYNLYPADRETNGQKSNRPMATSTADAGEYGVVGASAIAEVAGNVWEPGSLYKGDFSRSYMYMAVTYAELTWDTDGLVTMSNDNDNYPGLLDWASTLYRQWSLNDPIDDLERTRNDAAANIQGNRNLFVDFPYLAEYIWGDSVEVEFNPATTITTAEDDARYSIVYDCDLYYTPTSIVILDPTDESYTLPTLGNPHSLPVTITSSDESVAYIEDGNVVLAGALGETVITASFTDTNTLYEGKQYKAQSASYTMSVGNATLFTKVTSTSQLSSGSQYLIVYESGSKAMGAQSNTFRTYADVQVENSAIATPVNVSGRPYTVTLGGSTDAWTLQDIDGGYFKSAGTGNLTVSGSSTDTWSITFSEGDATITNGTYRIQYNSSNPRFAGYSSNQKSVQLYVASGTVKLDPALAYSASTASAVVGEAFTAPTLDNPYGLGVTYSSSAPSVATIDADGAVTILAAGVTTITAAFAGNTEYNSGSASYTLTVTEGSGGGELEGDIFAKVTSADQLVAGKRYLIVCEAESLAMSAEVKYSSSYYRVGSTITISDDKVAITDSNTDSTPYIFTLGGSDTEGWTLQDCNDLYLCTPSNSTNLRAMESPSGSIHLWTVDLNATYILQNKGITNRVIQYRADSSNRFASYSSSSKYNPVALYVEQETTTLANDVNLDGQVDVNDVTALVDIILGKWGDRAHGNTDINGDNSVDVNDVTALVDIILGKE